MYTHVHFVVFCNDLKKKYTFKTLHKVHTQYIKLQM